MPPGLTIKQAFAGSNRNGNYAVNQAVSDDLIEQLCAIGISLSSERDTDRLVETILRSAKGLTSADGGSVYSLTEDQQLKFELVSTDSLGLSMGGTTGIEIRFAPLPLYTDGKPNLNMVVTSSVLNDETINITDAYHADGYDFSGTKKFDEKTGYRTKSLLAVPMKNHENDIIGVLQLINAQDAAGEVVPFSSEAQRLAESLASQAAVALTNKRLIDDLKTLFESFIQLIAGAIDDKSPYTGGHCRRVPELTMMLAEAVSATQSGPLADFSMDDKDRYELHIAGWLHDCGKVTTPEYVMDKATKLETIYDRINEVDTRFAIIAREAEVMCCRERLAALERGDAQAAADAQARYEQTLEQLTGDRARVHTANVGGEFMSDEAKVEIERIAARTWHDADGAEQPLLSEEEVYNLSIPRGTLTHEERQVINNHIVATIKMLESLPFPKHLQRVPEYAGGHHERMDGKGYPKGLTREQMSVPARVMAIADIFEALTAQDRPYKRGKTLTECLQIMGRMRLDNHIDPDLFDIFIDRGVYRKYADMFMDEEQIDDVDLYKIPGYTPPDARQAG
jgi:HD-GYP domain-containing protein (c-di-GMP phosphodiesterase class II)